VTSRNEALTAVKTVLDYLGECNGARFGSEIYSRTPDRWITFLEAATQGMGEPEPSPVRFELERGGLVSLSEVAFYSLCEHHLLPFFGVVSIDYEPVDYVVGLSALVHVIERHARRLQLQERMTRDIADDVSAITGAKDVRVCVVAEHMCMSMRGVAKPGAQVTTRVALSESDAGDPR
jgi:GTP cyclohydrolase I